MLFVCFLLLLLICTFIKKMRHLKFFLYRSFFCYFLVAQNLNIYFLRYLIQVEKKMLGSLDFFLLLALKNDFTYTNRAIANKKIKFTYLSIGDKPLARQANTHAKNNVLTIYKFFFVVE